MNIRFKILKFYLPVVIVCGLLLTSCQTTDIDQKTQYNPCTDSLYLVLKKKNLDSLSKNEFSYFMQKDKDCKEFVQYKEEKTDRTNGRQVATALGILGAVASLVALLVILNNKP